MVKFSLSSFFCLPPFFSCSFFFPAVLLKIEIIFLSIVEKPVHWSCNQSSVSSVQVNRQKPKFSGYENDRYVAEQQTSTTGGTCWPGQTAALSNLRTTNLSLLHPDQQISLSLQCRRHNVNDTAQQTLSFLHTSRQKTLTISVSGHWIVSDRITLNGPILFLYWKPCLEAEYLTFEQTLSRTSLNSKLLSYVIK